MLKKRNKKKDLLLTLFAILMVLMAVAFTVGMVVKPTPHYQYVPDECACDDGTEKISTSGSG